MLSSYTKEELVLEWLHYGKICQGAEGLRHGGICQCVYCVDHGGINQGVYGFQQPNKVSQDVEWLHFWGASHGV